METRSPEKRKASARLKTEDTSTPADRKTKVRKIYARRSTASLAKGPATPRSNDSASPAPFPSRLAKDSPLPTASDVQDPPEAHVDESALQSIAESGVLASSLSRSRSKWITQGIFERYWTKPKTHKGVLHEPPKNPPKDSMQKLGRCKITIEPHVFEATLFTIREIDKLPLNQPHQPQAKQTPAQLQAPPTPQPPRPAPPAAAAADAAPPMAAVHTPQPIPAQATQQQSSSASPAPPPANVPSPLPSGPAPAETHQQPPPAASVLPTHTASVPSPPSTATPPPLAPATIVPPRPSSSAANSAQAPSSAKASPAPPAKPPSSQQPAQQAQSPATRPPAQAPHSAQQRQYNAPVQQPLPPVPKPVPGQDPVILMLAQRASTDPDLKVLMKIVASGQASKDQLAVFQGHIDELTAIITRHNQQQASQPAQAPQRPPAQYQSRPPQPFTQPKPMTFAYDPAHHTQPKFKAQPPVRLDITGACMEFDGSGVNDRLLFPKQAIVEHVPGSLAAKASFLVIRRGDNSSPSFELGKSYYQPVTMLITAENSRVLEPLTRAVAPIEEVRRNMAETMEKMQRAPRTELVLRLPAGEGDDSETPLTPAALDRKANLKSLPASMLTPTGRVKKRALVDDLEQGCQYCFAPVDGMPRDDDGLPVCRDCMALREKELLVSRPLVVRAPRRTLSGPRALVFAA